MAVVTFTDYQSTPPHAPSRPGPNVRSCFPNLTESLNLTNATPHQRLRRLAFVATLVLRLLHDLNSVEPFTFFLDLFTNFWAWPPLILHILFFVVFLWNMHLIVEMKDGARVVYEKRFERIWFDAFLGGVAVFHLGAVGLGNLMGLMVLDYETEAALFLAVLGVAWVTTWEPEPGVELPY